MGNILNLHSSVCMTMVVEKEDVDILSSLESIKPLIDYWVVVDRGTSEHTLTQLRETLRSIPGELIFFKEGSLTDALNLSLEKGVSKADAILAWKGDDTWIENKIPQLEADACILKIASHEQVLYEIRLINPKLKWKWIGMATPELFSPEATHYKMTPSVCIKQRPHSTTFISSCPYTLGRACKECNLLEAAYHYLSSYLRLFPESKNRFEALYLLATIKEQLCFSQEQVINSYIKAAENNPYPHDSFYRLASYLRENRRYEEALKYASSALNYPPIPHDLSFIPWSTRWSSHAGLVLEYTLNSFYLKLPSAQAGAFSLVKIQDVDPQILLIGEGVLRSHALENFKP